MNTELNMLAWSILFGIAQLLATISASTQQRGLKWNLSSRDQSKPPLTGVAGRLLRAFENFKETFPFFLGAIVLTQLLAKQSSMSAWGAQMYFWGRVLYVPVYAFDVAVIRTITWLVATSGIVLVLCSAL